ncbi:hypothetical protein GCM10017783_09010 [Deinococcus piscis]|uniref:Uncharacterized protein n=1 Tax=Deinococcus piscis TaxID=394230 RepID=A0ABQ3K2E2_9DEIO|nr:hypothetical protein [Deinococcus piscis]GHF99147.1 hypothetical protein GCM10017783_09010 [Deinococcus piscis]
MSDKNILENLADAAAAKINEGVDRASAAGHNVASKEGSLLDNASDKLHEGADRVSAEVNNTQARSSFEEAKDQISDALKGK